MVTITQFSDTHFSRPGNRSHGGFGYDTSETWQAAHAHAFGGTQTDLCVVTGDVADHGEADEYEIAIGHLSDIPIPTNVLPGNHDFHIPLTVSVPRPGLTMDRLQRVGPWLFIFADSNFDGRTLDADGRLVDNPDRIEATGALGPAEVAWIDDVIAASDAPYVWLWMHHPPAVEGGFDKPGFNAEVEGLITRNPNIAGIGAGHVHSSVVRSIGQRPVYLCPALTISFDIDNWTTLPPGYRTYNFADDGTVTSECHLLDDERWPRFDLPKAVISHMKGLLSWDDMLEAMGGTPG